MIENEPQLDVPSKELKQEFAMLVLDNTPDGSEGSMTYHHPDGRTIALMRPTMVATDTGYDGDDSLTQFDRSYSAFISSIVMDQDGNQTGGIEVMFKYDPATGKVIKDTSVDTEGIIGMINGIQSNQKMSSIGLSPTVSGGEFQTLVDDIKIAINSGTFE